MKRRDTARRGFTLLELMFIMAILGVLLAMTIPRLGGSAQRAALETTGRNMARLAEYARQVAVSQQSPTTLTIDPEAGQWWISLPFDGDDRFTRRIIRRSRGADHVALSEEEEISTLHPRLTFREILVNGEAVKTKDPVVVTFYPNGTSTGVQVIVENSRGRLLTIEVETATGRASAYRGEPKDFAMKLHEAGIDPGKFGLEAPVAAAEPTARDERFYRIGGAEQREAYYRDAAERIMSRARANYEQSAASGQRPGGGTHTPAPPPGSIVPQP